MKNTIKGKLLGSSKISKKKQIVLPDEALQVLKIGIGDIVAIRLRDGEIILTNGIKKEE